MDVFIGQDHATYDFMFFLMYKYVYAGKFLEDINANAFGLIVPNAARVRS